MTNIIIFYKKALLNQESFINYEFSSFFIWGCPEDNEVQTDQSNDNDPKFQNETMLQKPGIMPLNAKAYQEAKN